MSIRSSILALTPSVYWPMDEPAGPTAFDVSGAGLNGQYQPNTIFGLNGPEAGTNCIGSNAVFQGGVIRNGLPFFGTPALSCLMWVACNAGDPSADAESFGMGAHLARGLTMTINPANCSPQWLFNGNAIFNAGFTAIVSTWHLFAFSWDSAAGGTSHMQIDNGAFASLTGHAYTPTLTGDQVSALPPGGGGIAHFAAFNFVLTSAQISAVFNAVVGPQPWQGGGATLTLLNLIPLTTLLNNILALIGRDFRNTP
jgi:hypothetical protein